MAKIRRIKTDYCDITLQDYSSEVAKDIRKAVRSGLGEAGKEYRRLAKDLVRSQSYRTGRLYKSIGYQVTSTNSGEPYLKIGAKNSGSLGGGANHAHLVENGTGMRYRAYKRRTKTPGGSKLVNSKGKASTGTMPALPFLKPLKDNPDEARKKVEAQLRRMSWCIR